LPDIGVSPLQQSKQNDKPIKEMKVKYKFNNLADMVDELFTGIEDMNFSSFGRFPATNVRETNEAFLLDLIVPGRTKEDIKIHQEKDSLVVSSEVKELHEGDTYRRREFRLSPFKRTFRLPETADSSAISASYDNGILTISIAKREDARVQREITIE